MKGIGALLVLTGAALFCLLRRRDGLLPVRLARALSGDLAVLRCQICLRRAPLPQILEESLAAGPGALWLWEPLSQRLARGEDAVPLCWAKAVQDLPGPLDRLLGPLGPLLPQGGQPLEAAIEETRAALARFWEEETARQADQGRVTAALCLAGACLTILVFL